LESLLTGVRRGQPLRPIATVTTQRSVTQLVDRTGKLLAEVDDDTVHAAATGDAAAISSWREVEVELGEGDLRTLHRLGKRLRRAGAKPSRNPSKLSRALPGGSGADSPRAAGTAHAGQILAAYLGEQHQLIMTGDLALRRDEDRAVHKTRVAIRRFRSTLRVFGEFFDPHRAAALDGELQWYAGMLGEVRDRQVLRKRLNAMIDLVDDTLLLGPVRARIEAELAHEQADHWQRLLTALNSERYFALLADLDDWSHRPPHTAAAAEAARALIRPARHARRRVARKLKVATRAEDTTALHRVRKAAKRARYAAEATRPVIGRKSAKRQAHRYRDLQDLLGEHQDSIVSAEVIRRIGAAAGTTPGENGFTYGILHEREEHTARAARTKARRTEKRYT
jgi:CHAD domain-containing protein